MISVARILRTSQLTFIISNLAIYFLEQMKSPHSQSQNQKSQINNNSQRSRLFACLWLYSTSRLVTMAYNENKNNRRNHIFFTPFFMPSYFSSSSAKPVHHQTTTSNLIAVILHFFSLSLLLSHTFASVTVVVVAEWVFVQSLSLSAVVRRQPVQTDTSCADGQIKMWPFSAVFLCFSWWFCRLAEAILVCFSLFYLLFYLFFIISLCFRLLVWLVDFVAAPLCDPLCGFYSFGDYVSL